MSGRAFPTTRWSLVLAAAENSDAEALEQLCASYWQPVYAFIRGRGTDPDLARDLTQSFFTKLLEKRELSAADPERGRFRSFLLSAAKNFVLNEREKTAARKRGGDRIVFSLDTDDAEKWFSLHAAEATPDRTFERRWALNTLERAIEALQADFELSGKLQQFTHIREMLIAGSERHQLANAAAALGMTDGALAVAVSRARRRFREILREQTLATISEPGEVDDELRYLLQALANE